MSRLVLTAADGDPTEAVALDSSPDLAIGPDDVLVAIEAAPINPSDLAFEPGRRALGTEGVGRVLDAAAAVDQALVGRRVLILPTVAQGTWGDQVVVSACNVVPVSERADALQLAMLPGNAGAAWALLHDYATVQPGEWVGMTPANSGVGQAVIALARRAAIKTLAIVRREAAARQVRALGAERVVVDGRALGDRVADALGPARLRVLIDGGAQSLRELARVVEDGGSVVSFATVAGSSPVLPLVDRQRGVSLHTFVLRRWIRETPRDALVRIYGELTELVEHGALEASVEATYPLERHREAIVHARRSERTGKVLFTPGKRGDPGPPPPATRSAPRGAPCAS